MIKIDGRKSRDYTGNKNPNWGKGYKIAGEKNPNWEGGKVAVKCANCGNVIYRQSYRIAKCIRLFCNHICYGEWRQQNFKGERNPFWGKHHPKKTRDKISEIKIKQGAWVGKDNPKYGKKLSEKERQRISETHRGLLMGDKNPAWKGGVTSLSKIIRGSTIYNLWREAVFHRDRWQCQKCGQIGYKLHAHHIIPFSRLIEDLNITSFGQALRTQELWDINNGLTLCEDCHRPMPKNKSRKSGEDINERDVKA